VNYYNDNEPYAAEWLRNLIDAAELPQGDVDERSITDVQPDELEGYDQCHFFAGIGGWPLALRLAAWPDDAPVWTGSAPCQPFSQAGKGKGEADERHLWPEFRRLIKVCRPPVVFGEQVASKAGREWLARVRAEMEALGYAFGAADLCAPGVGAPHIRQRLFWVAESNGERHEDEGVHLRPRRPFSSPANESGSFDGVGNSTVPEQRLREQRLYAEGGCGDGTAGVSQCSTDGMGDAAALRRTGRDGAGEQESGAWSGCVAVVCRDGKVRRIKSGLQPLAHGIPQKLGPPLTEMGQVGIRAARSNRVGRLRGYGNAIVPQLAAEFIRAFMETTQ